MSTLYLLRHAKAGWALPGTRDIDRGLDATGRGDADATGQVMQRLGYLPALTLCSHARRARETLTRVSRLADTGGVEYLEALYSTDASGYLGIIREHGHRASLLVVAHNPMLEDLAMAVAGGGEPNALATLKAGFPTSGLAVISFEEPLIRIAPGRGYLEALLVPAKL